MLGSGQLQPSCGQRFMSAQPCTLGSMRRYTAATATSFVPQCPRCVSDCHWSQPGSQLGCSVGPQAQQYQPARRLARPRCQPLRPGLAARLQLDGPRSALAAPGAELGGERRHGWRESATQGREFSGQRRLQAPAVTVNDGTGEQQATQWRDVTTLKACTKPFQGPTDSQSSYSGESIGSALPGATVR